MARIADDLGITSEEYTNLERGEADLHPGLLMKMAGMLDVSVTDFFEDAVEAFREDMGKYGKASTDEMTNLTKAVDPLSGKIGKLTSELFKVKNPSGRPKKGR